MEGLVWSYGNVMTMIGTRQKETSLSFFFFGKVCFVNRAAVTLMVIKVCDPTS